MSKNPLKALWLFNQINQNDYSLQLMNNLQDESVLLAEHPNSVYTTFRTYHRFEHTPLFFRVNEHFLRISESCRLQNTIFQLNIDLVKKAIAEICKSTRITGELRIKLIYDPDTPFMMFILSEKLQTPDKSQYATGVRVVTKQYTRENPLAKTFGFTRLQHLFGKTIGKDINEILLLDPQEYILEGMSSNFFAFKNGILQTAGEGILHGITRQLILKIAPESGFLLKLDALNLSELPEISECFITSTSRGVLPVIKINNTIIGNGKPGENTRLLMQLYQKELEEELLPLL